MQRDGPAEGGCRYGEEPAHEGSSFYLWKPQLAQVRACYGPQITKQIQKQQRRRMLIELPQRLAQLKEQQDIKMMGDHDDDPNVWCVIRHTGEETTDNTTKPEFSWEIEEDLLPEYGLDVEDYVSEEEEGNDNNAPKDRPISKELIQRIKQQWKERQMDKLNQHKLWEQAHGAEGALYLQRKQVELQEFKQRRDRMIAECQSFSPTRLLALIEPHIYNICEAKFILQLAQQPEAPAAPSLIKKKQTHRIKPELIMTQEQLEAVKREKAERQKDRDFIDDSEIAAELLAERRARRQTRAKEKQSTESTMPGKQNEEKDKADSDSEESHRLKKVHPSDYGTIRPSPRNRAIDDEKEILVISDDSDDNDDNDEDDNEFLFSEDDDETDAMVISDEDTLKKPLVISDRDDDGDHKDDYDNRNKRKQQRVLEERWDRVDTDDCFIVEERAAAVERDRDHAQEVVTAGRQNDEEKKNREDEEQAWRRVEEEDEELAALLAADDDPRLAQVTDGLSEETRSMQDRELARAKKSQAANRAFRTEDQKRRKDSRLSEIRINTHNLARKPVFIEQSLAEKMKPHQIEGVRFIWNNICFNANGLGCILAHEQGLGKTFQVIVVVHTFLCAKLNIDIRMNHEMKQQGRKWRRVLVVLNKQIISTWMDEFARWVPERPYPLRIITAGNSDQRSRAQEIRKWHRREGGMLLITGHLLQRLTEAGADPSGALFSGLLSPDLTIVDEGTNIKNNETLIAQCLERVNTCRRVLLTGTPLQNNLDEYWAFINFVRPNFWRREEWAEIFANPIARGLRAEVGTAERSTAEERANLLNHITKRVSGFVNRQLLHSSVQLKPKNEFVLFCDLTGQQRQLYEAFLTYRDERGPSSGHHRALWDRHRLHNLVAHPHLFWKNLHSYRDECKQTLAEIEEAHEQGEESSVELQASRDHFAALTKLLATIQPNEIKGVQASGKMQVLMELLRQCFRRKEKVLIFSEFTASLDTIRFFLARDPMFSSARNRVMYHTGQSGEVMAKVQAFNTQPFGNVFVFLISTRAGGLGLNLTGASRVVLFEPCWNPTNNIQALSRAYRQGQTREVVVYHMVGAGTLEEHIHRRSLQKAALAARVVDERLTHLEEEEEEGKLSLGEFPVRVARPAPSAEPSGDAVLDAVFIRKKTMLSNWQRLRQQSEEAPKPADTQQLMHLHEELQHEFRARPAKKRRHSLPDHSAPPSALSSSPSSSSSSLSSSSSSSSSSASSVIQAQVASEERDDEDEDEEGRWRKGKRRIRRW